MKKLALALFAAATAIGAVAVYKLEKAKEEETLKALSEDEQKDLEEQKAVELNEEAIDETEEAVPSESIEEKEE